VLSGKALGRLLKVIILFAAILLGSGVYLVHQARAATPSSADLSTGTPSLTWTGEFYAFGANADPAQCPPAVDPFNLLCDHFFLNINLPSNFWQLNTGTVTITITWSASTTQNDFDLYIYRQSDGAQVGSSTAGGGETQEQVALQNPIPGVYEVRVTPFLVIDSGYSGSAALTFTAGGPASNPSFPTGGIGFSTATIVDSQRTEGEPLVHIDQAGNIWESGPWGFSTAQGFVAKSTDSGASFHIVSPFGLRPNPAAAGGGDSDIITDDNGNAYFADLEGLVSVGVAVSNDGGNNWRENSLSSTLPLDDRQWLAVDNGLTSSAQDNTIFLTYRQIPGGSQVLSSPGSTGSTDPTGGFVYINAATTTFVASGAPCGRLIFDPVLRFLYLPCVKGDHVEVAKAHVNPGQRTGLQFSLVETPKSPGGSVGHLFASLTADQAGNLYVAWVDTKNNNVYLSVSSNAGSTWSRPLQVNGDPANTNVMPWAVAGAPGIVDIVFYGTSARGDPNTFPSWLNNRQAATAFQWFTYFVQVQGATTKKPIIYQVQASEHPTDYGQLCTQGLGCTTSGGDRTLTDFFSVALDANGAARIVIDDLTNQHHGAALFELTQVAGPSAFGTTLTPQFPNVATSVTDPSGDAQVPHYSPLGAGANQPALDLLSVQLSQPDTSHLSVTLKLSSLANLLPPGGSTGLLWLTRWQFKTTGDGGEESFRIFYLGANSTGGQSPVFFAGTGTSAAPTTGVPPGDGCVTTTPQNCKVIVYPSEEPETGNLDPSTNTITITAPLSDIGSPLLGERLYSVTALTYGFTKGNPILTDADATRAFDYILAQTVAPSNCPLGTTCKVTGGGYIFVDVQQDHGSFSIEVTVDPTGHIRGKAAYIDQATGLDFRTSLITSVNFSGNSVTISGIGTANGSETSFAITVKDIADPGVGKDTFSIQLGTGYSKSGVLQGGNIQIH
jgi:hypothetical protein